MDELVQELRTGDHDALFSVSKALGAIGKSAIPSLIPLLKDSDERVRSSAAKALKQLGYKP